MDRGDRVRDSCADHHGTIFSGTPNIIEDPVRGRVGSFPGRPSCVSVPDAPELAVGGQVTMSAWVRAELTLGANGIISKRQGMNNNMVEFGMFFGLDQMLTIDIAGDLDRFATPIVAEQRWMNLTVTYNGGAPAAERVRSYLDGKLVHTGSEPSAQIVDGPAPLMFGCMLDGVPESLTGLIDDAIVWGRALAPDEVWRWYSFTR